MPDLGTVDVGIRAIDDFERGAVVAACQLPPAADIPPYV
jgi:hypothetical protein